MYQAISYQGKQSDSMAAVLLMAMEAVGVKNVPHPNCLTTRPFNFICPLDIPQLWLAPFPNPLDGIWLALKILGIQHNCQMMPINSINTDTTVLLTTIEQWLKNGPVIVGPLDRTKIWDRIDSRYYRGTAHFIFIIDYGNNHNLIAHDPEGCPYFLISKQKLLSALNITDFDNAIIQIQSTSGLRLCDEIFQQALISGIKNCAMVVNHPEGGSNGLRSLAQMVASRKLKSSEEGALNFAIPTLSLSAKQLSEFLLDMPDSVICNISNWNKVMPKIFNVLSDDCINCAYALEFLQAHEQVRLSEQLLKIANNKKQLEELLISMMPLNANEMSL